MSFKVFIPTAGIGSRLGSYTKYINKSLISINNEPVISHQLRKFPKDCEFIIALGYKGKLVKEFLEIAYPKRFFKYIQVDNYQGKGSGLGHTILSCKDFLQDPFIFLSCDTLVEENIKKPDFNWMGYAINEFSNSYRLLKLKDNNIINIKNKDFPKNEYYPYIGLSGIKNYELFWNFMDKNSTKSIQDGESYAFKSMLSKDLVKGLKYTWHDTGQISNLKKAREAFEDNEYNILEKEEEAIWFVNKKVIKFSNSKDFIRERVIRSRKLKPFVPEIYSVKENMYAYNKIESEVISRIINLDIFKSLLDECKLFWEEKELDKNEYEIFKSTCNNFYKNKTYQRLKNFYSKYDKKDTKTFINNKSIPSLEIILNNVSWNNLSKGKAGRFHGDFHFENILFDKNKNKFSFIDWRQNFGNYLDIGDIYYDLAKLLHGLIVSHELISKGKYKIKWIDNKIHYGIYREKILIECEKFLYEWCQLNNYEIKKIKQLTALIFLNIASLHHYPYCLFLYALGKDMLHESLSSNDLI